MFFQDYTRFIATTEMPLALTAAASNIQEGSILMSEMESGKRAVKLSDGSTNSVITGVAVHQMRTFDLTSFVESFTIPTPSGNPSVVEYRLQNTPVGGVNNILVKSSSGTVFSVQTNDPSSTGQVKLDGDKLVFHSSDFGKYIDRVVYRYSPSTMEVQYLVGDGVPGLELPIQSTNTTGVVLNGWIYTDQFDPKSDFSQNKPIKAGANGLLTLDGPGTEIPGYVVSAPTTQVPFLGYYINL